METLTEVITYEQHCLQEAYDELVANFEMYWSHNYTAEYMVSCMASGALGIHQARHLCETYLPPTELEDITEHDYSSCLGELFEYVIEPYLDRVGWELEALDLIREVDGYTYSISFSHQDHSGDFGLLLTVEKEQK